jgi:hypothetical protein
MRHLNKCRIGRKSYLQNQVVLFALDENKLLFQGNKFRVLRGRNFKAFKRRRLKQFLVMSLTLWHDKLACLVQNFPSSFIIMAGGLIYGRHDTLHKGLNSNIQHNTLSLCWVSRIFSVMLNVIMLNVVLLNVIMLNVILLSVIMLSVIMLNIIMLNVILWVSLCWMSLFWMSWCWISLCWLSFCYGSLC